MPPPNGATPHSSWRARMKRALAFLALVITLGTLPAQRSQAQTPSVPTGFELVDLITNNSFEIPATALGFDPSGENDGSAAYTTVNPLAGSGSMKVMVNSYGRVLSWHPYGYGSAPSATGARPSLFGGSWRGKVNTRSCNHLRESSPKSALRVAAQQIVLSHCGSWAYLVFMIATIRF